MRHPSISGIPDPVTRVVHHPLTLDHAVHFGSPRVGMLTATNNPDRVVRAFEEGIDRTLAAMPFNVVLMGPGLAETTPAALLLSQPQRLQQRCVSWVRTQGVENWIEDGFGEPSIMFGGGPVQPIEGGSVLAQSHIDDG